MGGGGVFEIQSTCLMCIVYVAHMAFGAYPWGGVRDI